MRLDKKKSHVISNNQHSSSVGFKIGDATVVIDILRNRLYKNPIQTLVQEYLSNARDAHREAGREARPVEVTLPTRANPVFRIRDFGPGLSKDRVETVFVLYGVSTKRDSDTQTGGFGIGAKSAWAYSDHFTVTSVHGGKKTVYVAHTGNSIEGELETIGSSASSEESGVEIQIPVRPDDRESFFQAVLRATYYWTVRPKLMGVTKDRIPESFSAPVPLLDDKAWQVYATGSMGEASFNDEDEEDEEEFDDNGEVVVKEKPEAREKPPVFGQFLDKKGAGSFGITAAAGSSSAAAVTFLHSEQSVSYEYLWTGNSSLQPPQRPT